MSEEKAAINMKDIKQHNMNKDYFEFAVKNAWPQIKDSQKLKKYLPIELMAKGVYPDRVFFWNIVFTIEPEWANEYVSKVIKNR